MNVPANRLEARKPNAPGMSNRTRVLVEAMRGERHTTPLRIGGYFVRLTPDGQWQPGWVPSQEDLVAEDWIVMNPEDVPLPPPT